LKVIGEDTCALSLPEAGVTVNHDADGVPTVQDRASPPVFWIVMVCAAGLVPAVVVNARLLALSVICGGGIVMVTAIVDGLPATTLPVNGSIAVIVTLVAYDLPPGKPVALISTLVVVLVPPSRLVPDFAESEIKLGAAGSSAAVQFNGVPPALVIVICCELVPVEMLKLRP